MRCPRQASRGRGHRHGQWHGRGFGALADQMQHSVAALSLLVVLDPDGGGFGGAQGVDSEEERQGAVVHGEGLGDLEEPGQFEPVEALGAGLIGVDSR